MHGETCVDIMKSNTLYGLLCALLLLSTTALAAEREAVKPAAPQRQFLMVLTPATGIGDALAKRLRAAGMEITARQL